MNISSQENTTDSNKQTTKSLAYRQISALLEIQEEEKKEVPSQITIKSKSPSDFSQTTRSHHNKTLLRENSDDVFVFQIIHDLRHPLKA